MVRETQIQKDNESFYYQHRLMDIRSKINKLDMTMLKKIHKKIYPFKGVPSEIDRIKFNIINAINNSVVDSKTSQKIKELIQNEIEYMYAYNACYDEGIRGRKLRIPVDASEGFIGGAKDGYKKGSSELKKRISEERSNQKDRKSKRVFIIGIPSSCTVM
jgi:hypothetical protein